MSDEGVVLGQMGRHTVNVDGDDRGWGYVVLQAGLLLIRLDESVEACAACNDAPCPSEGEGDKTGNFQGHDVGRGTHGCRERGA